MENITPGGGAINKAFTPKPGKLMDQVRETLRFHHYACSTEKKLNLLDTPQYIYECGSESFYSWTRLF